MLDRNGGWLQATAILSDFQNLFIYIFAGLCDDAGNP
ncbi:hypothetical protein O77CONTIG1_02699 [Leptolyngbya sp. O-77]|nr:hypothetical protein O77CONTIG1_02699 [Leptolyngbya sp. O-77]